MVYQRFRIHEVHVFFYKQVPPDWSGSVMLRLATNPSLIYAKNV